MKSLKINKEDALVHSKWRRLIRGTEGDSDDSEGLNVQSFTDTSSPGLSWKKGCIKVVVVNVLHACECAGRHFCRA